MEGATDEAIAKIRKIMRLVRRAATEGERQAALQAAKRLAAQSGLELSEFDGSDTDIAQTIEVMDEDGKTTNKSTEVRLASQVLFRQFGVLVVFNVSKRYGMNEWGDRVRKSDMVTLTWVGNRLNIGVAKYAMEIMLRESRKHWRVAHGCVSSLKREHFMRGWFYRIEKELIAHPLRNDRDVLEKEKEDVKKRLERMERERNMGKFRESRRDPDAESVMQGFSAAGSVKLSRPMDGGGYAPTQRLGVA